MNDYNAGDTINFKFTSRGASGPSTLTSGVLSIYKNSSTTESTSGVTLSADFDGLVGLNNVTIDTSTDGTFYANGSFFDVVLTDGTVDGYPVDGEVVGRFALRQLDVYQAKVWIIDDNTGPADRYIVIWYKNGEPIVAGITLPLIQVYKTSDGTDLVASTAMTEIPSTGTYRYTEATNRIADGASYIAKVSATISGAVRTWYQPIGRDS